MDYKYTGIMLGKMDVGETDRIYFIYTLERGKIRALAKGIKKPQAKLAGLLESITLADISVIKKNGTGKITGSIIENNFSNIKNNPKSLGEILETLNKFNRFIVEEEKDERIFDLLKEYLETVNELKLDNSELFSLGFLFKLLDFLGYKIEVGKCINCSDSLSLKKNIFSAKMGGMLCEKCLKNDPNGVLFDTNSIKIIRIFFSNSIKSLGKLKVSEKELRKVKSALNELINWTAA